MHFGGGISKKGGETKCPKVDGETKRRGRGGGGEGEPRSFEKI